MRTAEEIKARIKEIEKICVAKVSKEQMEAVEKECIGLIHEAEHLLKIELKKQFGPMQVDFVEAVMRNLVELPPATPPVKSFTDFDL